MNSSDSNTSLSTDESKPSQQNVLERVADRSAKNIFFKTHGCNLCFEQKVIDYKNPAMLSKFASQNGRILSSNNTN
jgi:ribosomal protein S18